MTSSSNNHLAPTRLFSVQFDDREERFLLEIGKLSSLVALKNKIEDKYFKKGKHIKIDHLTYLDSCTDIMDDFVKPTIIKFWYKLLDDSEVQFMFACVNTTTFWSFGNSILSNVSKPRP